MPKPTSRTGNEVLLTASRFTVERVTQQLDDGSTLVREVIKHPGAVVIVPVMDDGRICLIRNYRISIDQVLLELPAAHLNRRSHPSKQPVVS